MKDKYFIDFYESKEKNDLSLKDWLDFRTSAKPGTVLATPGYNVNIVRKTEDGPNSYPTYMIVRTEDGYLIWSDIPDSNGSCYYEAVAGRFVGKKLEKKLKLTRLYDMNEWYDALLEESEIDSRFCNATFRVTEIEWLNDSSCRREKFVPLDYESEFMQFLKDADKQDWTPDGEYNALEVYKDGKWNQFTNLYCVRKKSGKLYAILTNHSVIELDGENFKKD